MRRGCFILAFLTPLICLAQLPSENKINYTTKDGLSNNTVEAIVKDVRGFLWIGSGEGLCRFDGSHFSQFFYDPNRFSTLSGNNIYDVLEYQPGRLLIATSNGLSVLNTFTNLFENEKISMPFLRRGSGAYVKSLFKDRKGRIFVNYNGEIDVLSNDLHFIYRLTDTDWGRPLKGIIINFEQWVEDSKGRIWIPSANFGICILDEQAHTLYYYDHNPMHYSFLQPGGLRSFYYDEANGKVFFSGLGGGLEKHDVSTGTVAVQYFNIPDPTEARTINTIIRKGNRLICCSGQRVYSLDPETLAYEPLYREENPSDKNSFIDCSVALDDSENIWIGTETKGLVQVSYRPSYVQKIPLPYTQSGFPNSCTGIFRQPRGLLYFAYGLAGLVEVDQQKNAAKTYALYDEKKRPLSVQRICADSGDNILLGTSTGCFLFNTVTKKSARASWMPSSTNEHSIGYLLRDSRGNCWMSFKWPNALAYYDAQKRLFHYYGDYYVDTKAVYDPAYTINRIIEDEAGNIWMASSQAKGEIIEWKASSGEWKSYPETPRARKLFEGRELNGIYVSDAAIWAGNIYGLGLVRYDYVKDSILQIGRNEGLMSDNIYAVNKGRDDHLFICTMAGIDYLNTTTGEIRPVLSDDGTVNWGYAFIQYYDSAYNQLVYGLNDQIVIARSELWEAAANDSLQTYIDDIKVDNQLYLYDGSPIRLGHSQKNISIRYTSIDYKKNTLLSYAYKMQGVDKDWNMSSVMTTNYFNLSPGEYTFMVKTRDQSGIWGPVNSTLHITILPAIWQMSGFWVVTGLLVALVIIVLVRRRINQIRKSAELKQKLAESEMMALRAQMNPHFIFNCLSAIDHLVQTNQTDKATSYLSSFARLIRSLLEHSKNNLVPFYKDLESLQLYLHLEKFRTSNKFSYDLEVDGVLLTGDYKVPPMIVQPFVENAILHGLLNKESGERNMSIQARLRDEYILYIITDNGVGRARAGEIKAMNKPEHQSYGIQITTERLQLHNGKGNVEDVTITDLEENGRATGTMIEVRIKTG